MSDAAAPRFFATQKDFRRWLERSHDRKDEQWVGFYKKGSGMPSITWPESVDEALCFGWIDGLRKRVDDTSYMIRFTPRRPGSHWSAKNLARIEELIDAGRVHDAGLATYESRNPANQKRASYEQAEEPVLDADLAAVLEENREAWAYLQAARPSYRKQVTWWIMSAKREETRRRRLDVLIEASAKGEWIPAMRWAQPKS